MNYLILQKQTFLSAIQNCDKTTVLADAAYHGDLQVVQLLLDQCPGAFSTLAKPRDDGYSLTPLHEAVRGQHVGVCELLSKEKKNYIKTSDILFYAARIGNTDICKILINNSTNVNVKNNRGDTPLHYAICCQSADMCRFFIDARADVNVRNNSGFMPLHSAARYQGAGVCKMLIDAGAEVNVESFGGSIPLHYAVRYQGVSTCEVLIDAGADVDFENNGGSTPLHCAAYGDKVDVVKLLIDKGANPFFRNDKGETVFKAAMNHGSHSVVQFLEQMNINDGWWRKEPSRGSKYQRESKFSRGNTYATECQWRYESF